MRLDKSKLVPVIIYIQGTPFMGEVIYILEALEAIVYSSKDDLIRNLHILNISILISREVTKRDVSL